MSLIGLLIFIIILGLIFWAISLLPLPEPFRTIAYVILIIIFIIFLVQMLGVNTGINMNLGPR